MIGSTTCVPILLALLRATSPAGADGPEKPLIPGPIKIATSWFRVSKDFEKVAWKLDWANYPYKNHYPSVNESGWYWHDRGTPSDKKLPFLRPDWRKKAVPFVPARRSFNIRFFDTSMIKRPGYSLRCVLSATAYCQTYDWSGHEVVRIDARLAEDAHVWWAIEDRWVQPPVVGGYDLKAGKWYTLEIDLEKAAKDRKLEVSRMWRMWADVNTSHYKGAAFKNVRLARRDAKSACPILRDPDAAKLPRHPPARKPPTPDVPPDLTALAGPIRIQYRSEHPLAFGLDGFVAVYDAKRILLVASEGSRKYTPKYSKKQANQWERFAVQTLDGGKTWTGLDGRKDPTLLHITLGTRGGAIDAAGGAIYHNENGCGNNPGPRHRISKFSFLGRKGWTFNRKDYIFDEDSRHCSHYHVDHFISYVRVPSGRLWAAWKVEGRIVPEFIAVHAKYSDNDGATWQTWKEGRVARIPGLERKYAITGTIVPYGEHVAVLASSSLETGKWTYFNGSEWSAPKDMPGRPASAVTVGEKTIIASVSSYYDAKTKQYPGLRGVVRLADGRWVTELKGKAAGVPLCLSGQSVLAIGPGRGGISVLRRSPEGQWSGPRTYKVDGTIPPKSWYVPRICPPNLGAMVYTTKEDPNTINILLVPNRSP